MRGTENIWSNEGPETDTSWRPKGPNVQDARAELCLGMGALAASDARGLPSMQRGEGRGGRKGGGASHAQSERERERERERET